MQDLLYRNKVIYYAPTDCLLGVHVEPCWWKHSEGGCPKLFISYFGQRNCSEVQLLWAKGQELVLKVGDQKSSL